MRYGSAVLARPHPPQWTDSRRQRAAVVVFESKRLAVIARERPGIGPYLVFPGGGVEPGETPAQAAVREALEETGLRVEVAEELGLRLVRGSAVQWFFPATAVGGTFGTGTGVEVTGGRPENGTYEPRLLTRDEVLAGHLVPLPVAEAVLRTWSTGQWWEPSTVEDPEWMIPRRIRAGAIVIRDQTILLIERHNDRDTWYEIPGGGVDEGEEPGEAADRELWEETGLMGRVEREVAVVFREGTRQHYLRFLDVGPGFPRDRLDLEPDASPVWIPLAELPDIPVWPRRLAWRIAAWARDGWPDTPVRLSDSIEDLHAPCDW
jgi:8-oxo-dGTP pyrophosphatase MutT (NUDIX family)